MIEFGLSVFHESFRVSLRIGKICAAFHSIFAIMQAKLQRLQVIDNDQLLQNLNSSCGSGRVF